MPPEILYGILILDKGGTVSIAKASKAYHLIKTASEMGLGTNDPNNIHLEMLSVQHEAVTAEGKLKTTWGDLKKYRGGI